MLSRTRLAVVAVILSFAVSACGDVPSPSGVDVPGPSFAKGGRGSKGGGQPPSGGIGITALGGLLFADQDLSLNQNESCQTCHEPSKGFAGPLDGVNTKGSVVEGSVSGRYGDRKPPSAAFATVAPLFSSAGNNASGGNFWDGRATGDLLGNPAMDQALGPFLNPNEQAMPDEACVILRISQATYAADFNSVFGTDLGSIVFPSGVEDVETVCTTFTENPGELVSLSPGDRTMVHEQYLNVARAIAAYENTFNTFDSPFDQGSMSDLAIEGQKLFGSKGKCQQCHDNKGSNPLFTEFEFHNLGVPLNPDNPVYNLTSGTFDPGLGGITGNPAHLGKFRTATVRNVAQGTNRTYMHNGALVSLRKVVQFYNTRDVLPVCTSEAVLKDPTQWGPDGAGCWPPPEYGDNLDTNAMGNLGLTDHEVDAIVAYMEAMTGSGGGG